MVLYTGYTTVLLSYVDTFTLGRRDTLLRGRKGEVTGYFGRTVKGSLSVTKPLIKVTRGMKTVDYFDK